MKFKVSTYFLVLSCYFFSFHANSQDLETKKITLFEVLTSVEKQYSVSFTYANKIIEEIKIVPNIKGLSLKETINYLKSKTQLSFIYLTPTNILINKPIKKNLICGYLVDINLKIPIEGVSVAVLNRNSISAIDGYFELDNVTANQIITISHLSYPTIYLNSNDFLSKSNCLTINNTQKVEMLNEVILNNYLTSGITITTNNTITIDVLNSGILPGLIEPDILQKIQAIPGISSINETISNINIRGGSNDQNLLLWDDIRMYHSGHFFGLISAFNPYLTDKVTLTKNGTSAQYNDGVSGTINIESINEISKKPFGGGGFNLLSADAFAHISISNNIGFQFTGRRAITDIINTPTFEQYYKKTFQDSKITASNAGLDENNISNNSTFNFFDYSFKILYNFNKNHKLRLSYLKVDNQLHFDEFLQSETISDSKTSELEQSNVAVGLHSTNQWSSNFRTLFHTYYTKYNVHAENFTLLNDQRLIQINEVLETGIKLNTYYKFNKNIQLLNGYHYYELGITNSEDVNLPLFIRTIKNVIRNHAVYSEINAFSNNNKTFINAGFRVNYLEKFNNFIIEPRVQALHKISSNISFKIAGEFKSQNATQIIDLQEDFLGVENNRWTLADNNEIPIIKSKQASAGINYKKNNFFVDVEGFYKFVDGITTANQGFQNQNQHIKTSGSYISKGIEFLANKKTENFSIWVGYTYNINDYEFKELTPAVFPNNLDITHSISFGNTLTLNNIDVALGLNWRTGKPHTTPTSNNAVTNNGISSSISYNQPNSERLPNYFRADISSTYNFKLSKKVNGMAGISILNFLDTKNTLNTYYEVNTENSIDVTNNTSIGITPNLTFRVYF
ncbi:MAG: TonB-dependent receptor plug domain-containing protein [Lutibacter sp.]|uniref:TonB-dependent receptor n=1 Tax=Lutibacter sp. TaxID=1925666 RepID=UPI00183D7055|nr:TonB-dependent receptor plug domain-containing protein [Lutibacter sp.]MBT8318329.1 TonB-dependent receptor [Lutibacter sp.]NNJ59187.1 TonB-dependent receptor plug domain-containing protein [Lutibacter sp.]